jgi:hypothetical protein
LYNVQHQWVRLDADGQRVPAGDGASKDSDSLYRDGHWGSAARTFQVAVDRFETYSVRVYVGDASFARNNIQVSKAMDSPTGKPKPIRREWVHTICW